MSNRIYKPKLNVIHFVDKNPVVIPQYTSKHMDDYLFSETILRHEQTVGFKQPWMINDAVRLQYVTNYQPVVLKLFRCDGSLVYSATFDTKQEDADNPGFYIRQVDLDLATFGAGDYYYEIWLGNGVSPALKLISEPQVIYESWSVPNLYIEFSNFEKYGGIWFQAPFSPAIRIPATLKYDDTESVDTIYPDQDENEEILHSTPYRVWKLFVGDAPGIPSWFKDKISRIFGCSDIKIDGRYYTKVEGAKWERGEQKNYPMKGWTINLRERYNRESDIYDNDAVLKGIAAAGLIQGTKGFGMDDQSSNDYLEIESLI